MNKQIDKLAKYIMENVPGEPSKSEGAVDCAIRIMNTLDGKLWMAKEAIKEVQHETSVSTDELGIWIYQYLSNILEQLK